MIRVSSGSFGIEFDRRLTRNDKASSAKTKAAVRVMSISPRPQTRLLLWIGFGGLLGLLGFAGFSSLSIVREIQVRNLSIRRDYLERDRILEQLRSDIYLSGTYVRDFLLEADHAKADGYRTEFERTRARIERALGTYEPMVHPEEAAAFRQ